MSKKENNWSIDNHKAGSDIRCPKCNEKLVFYYDDDGKLQSYCPNCEEE